VPRHRDQPPGPVKEQARTGCSATMAAPCWWSRAANGSGWLTGGASEPP